MSKNVRAVFIIAEAGVNHNGRLDLALRLCDAAKEAGVDAVKFQTWITEDLLTENTDLAEYQKAGLESESSQYEMLKKLELSHDIFRKIKAYCEKIGIPFLSTPDEPRSLDFLLSIGMGVIKVGSGEVTNIPYLRYIGSKNRDVILSTGMSSLGEVERAYNELLSAGSKSVALLHCTTNYPCPMDEVNLNAMITMKNAFNTKVGYSDHTMGIEIPIAAVAMGAEIIEKHFTLDRNMEGPDHKASLDTVDLCKMVSCIRNIEQALGDGIKKPNESEILNKKIVQKSIVAKRNISKGELFSAENMTTKRANGGIPAQFWDAVIGRYSDKNYNHDDLIDL